MNTLGIVLLNITGIGDWGMIFLAIVFLFGGTKIPQLMRGIGQGVSEFNRAKNSVNAEFQEGMRQGNQNQTPAQNQSNSNASPANTLPPPSSSPTDHLQKQIEQLQQQLNQLKQQQH